MTLSFKTGALVGALALAATAAQAAGGSDLGPVPPTASFSNTVAGAFTDTWQFTLASPSTVTAGVFNVSFSVLGNSSGSVLGFQAWLDGVQLFGGSSSQEFSPGVFLSTQTQAAVSTLGAGIHTVTVSGTGITGGSASYSGYVQAVPVPEPETYALLGAGLGVIGFVAARRRREH